MKKQLKPISLGITKEMTMGEIIEKIPEAADVMLSYGLHCIGCFINSYETLEEGALGHGLTPGDIDHMVREINALAQQDHAPQVVHDGITVTDRAITQIKTLQKKEEKQGWPLQLEYLDLPSGEKEFFMEFIPQPLPFHHKIVLDQDVILLIAKENMADLQGLTIDYAEGPEGGMFRFQQH
jgi:hybrid cluster-associated redox disulfide protein